MNDDQKLLRECSAGIKTAVDSIDEIMPYVKDEKFQQILSNSKAEHKKLEIDVDKRLENSGSDDKEPNPMAKTMSWMKINAELSINPTSAQAASLVTDGCDMGIKSLHKYINKYVGAEQTTKDIARNISELEEALGKDMRPYL
ncbi:MAG: hypothetical protein MJ173_07770 [Clostridia bacterium]|nr:hypothetical protein [Clostridia bacterium]